MKLKLLVSVLVFTFFQFLSSCSDDGISTPLNDIKLEQEIDRICDSVISNTKLPGMLVGVWDKKHRLNYLKGHGLANKENSTPMTSDLLFRIGSNTKSFVITRILQLVDEKKISLYDKLSKYYPDFPKSDLITVKMLCDMSSGIYNYTESSEFANIIENNPLHKWTIEEYLDIAKKYNFYFEPGSGIKYSNTNTVLLEGIVEKLDNDKLRNVLKNKIFDKYGLSNTYFPSDNKMPSQHYVHGYANYTDTLKFDDDVSESFDLSWCSGAGAIISDINDVRKWVTLLIDGGLISDSLQTQRFEGTNLQGNNAKYAQGIFTYLGTDMWGHNGGLPGYTSVMMRHKTLDRTIVIFYNMQGKPTPDDLFRRLNKLLESWE